jgi:hypothetical protein
MTLLRTVETLAPHRSGGERHVPGETYTCAPSVAQHLARYGYVKVLPWQLGWHALEKRELRRPIPEMVTRPVVACLNIWNDTPALERTAPEWWPHVDAVVIADGAYRHVGEGPSTDGLKHVVGLLAAEHGTAVTWVRRPKAGWTQCEKRTALLQKAAKAYPEARLVIVDADEFVTGMDSVKTMADVEVGWAMVTNPLYERAQGQPRVIRASHGLHYDGRHHWLYRGDDLLATHQYGGNGIRHGVVGMQIHNARGLGHSAERKIAKVKHLAIQRYRESATGDERDAQGARETLRILQLGRADAGLVAYRFHTALNTTTPHASALVIGEDGNPYGGPRQFGWMRDRETVEALAEMADVLHCHLNWQLLKDLTAITVGWHVIHHHGTMYRRNRAIWAAWDLKYRAVLRLVSNTELLQYDTNLTFLPNPMPVGWYRQVKAMSETGPGFRVAHSPSKRANKGTEVFLRACERAKVEPVLIEGQSHAESIRQKATCHAAFDSFWLGMQCSGLEAAAMGLPVIGGDPDCKREYEQWLGQVPYTWANDEDALVEALERLAHDPAFYREEADRVSAYTLEHHDDAAVSRRYLDLLDERVHWRQALRVSAKPIKHRVPSPITLLQSPMTQEPAAVLVPAMREPLQESA